MVELEVRKKHNASVLATKENGKLTPLAGSTHILNPSETLLILGSRKDMQKSLKSVM